MLHFPEFHILSRIAYFISNKHASASYWNFRMLVQHYMPILEQLMFTSERK
jgi:hypothetical protein